MVKLQESYINQSNLGWDQFARGRISTAWSNLVNCQLQEKSFDTDACGSRLISIHF